VKVLIILSGGMDSATALAWALDQKHEVIAALNFQYGAKQNQREALSVKALTEYYAIPYHPIELGFINTLFKSTLLQSGGAIPEGHYTEESMKSTVVPFRNGIMLSIAAGVAESLGAHAIILGNHYGDHATYPDCRSTFIEPMTAAIREGTDTQIQLLSPFCDLQKSDIARLGHSLSVPYALTYTCYKGGEKHCGCCGSCTSRKEAFHTAGLVDPTDYIS
jgi:7-cyano-7-deazaguanine synthase